MIHILTIHWKKTDWIEIQLKYLQKNVCQPFKLYGYFNHINQETIAKYNSIYEYISTDPIKSHPIKLNLLAEKVCKTNSDDDIIVFIDGDAFPINTLDSTFEQLSKETPLIAVQRTENYGDIQPHPCFCCTTVGFWKKISGDWQAGDVTWTDSLNNQVSDVGGILLSQLQKNNIQWIKLNRSNKNIEGHPLLFAIYANLIYHHGAGFRSVITRSDSNKVKLLRIKRMIYKSVKLIFNKHIANKYFAPFRHIKKQNNDLSDKMLKEIKANHFFYKNIK